MNAFAAIGPARRVAVLVDGENLSARHADAIGAVARRHGIADTRRVYGDLTRLPGWCAAPGYRPMHSCAGRNAADMLLCIDAIELALGGGYPTVVIASGDGDFVSLAQRLRDRGVAVVGVGLAHASETFREACTSFETLGSPVAEAGVAVPSVADRQIRTIIAERSQKGLGIRLVELDGLMSTRHAFAIGATSDRRWRTYLERRADLFDVDPPSKDARVRFRPEAFARP